MNKPGSIFLAVGSLLMSGTISSAHQHQAGDAQHQGNAPDSAREHCNQTEASISAVFAPFSSDVSVRFDENFFYVESTGFPDHPMMIGITAWQQQVPIPQPYSGSNAWRIPRKPIPAANPLSAKSHFFRGAIALAANGVPIFNPIKNDGRTNTFLAGELDEFGGHSGRADDYHYHIAPIHLQEAVGQNLPVAYALDGYPIYGFDEPDGSPAADLDSLNGHHTPTHGYHYHATKSYPYLNGGFYGEVTERDGQVDPQPRARGPRPATRPLRGAHITAYEGLAENRYLLTYRLKRADHLVRYTFHPDRSAEFEFVAPDGSSTIETYDGKSRRNGGGGNQGDRRNGSSRERSPRRAESQTGAREPWLKAHLTEIDHDENGLLSAAELAAEIDRTFTGYDRNEDGNLVSAEYRKGQKVRSPLAGFVVQHATDIDQNSDEIITRAEFESNVMRMFERLDADDDGTITPDEFQTQSGRTKPTRS